MEKEKKVVGEAKELACELHRFSLGLTYITVALLSLVYSSIMVGAKEVD